jgi:carboxylesterase
MVSLRSLPTLSGAEPFHYEAAGDLACVLIHGFTGSAYELNDLGLHLAASGITARGVLLSGHGTRPEDMAQFSYLDWIADAQAAVEELLAEGKRVFLCGLSMGGTLALNVAARRSRDPRIAGVIALAAPLRFTDWRLRFLGVAHLVVRWHSWGRPDIKDQTQWERHVAYPRFHIRALVQLVRLLQETRRTLHQVHQPLLVVQSRQDHTVPPFNAELIVRGVSSERTRIIWLEDCYHVITLDYEARQVFEAVSGFIQEHASPWASSPS